MLDEKEWELMDPALTRGLRNIQAQRQERQVGLDEIDSKTQFAEALDLYERLTGFRETNHLAIYHHRLSLYGPPCKACGKPLRTPQAKLCAACGAPRTAAA